MRTGLMLIVLLGAAALACGRGRDQGTADVSAAKKDAGASVTFVLDLRDADANFAQLSHDAGR